MDSAEIVVLSGPLSSSDAESVHRLAASAERTDGVAPLSEQPLLWLQDAAAPARHLLVRAADDLAGYAQLDLGSDDTASAELVVHPFARRHGVGSALFARLRDLAEGRRLSVWAHGDLPAARSLATAAGWGVVRELLKMRLELRGSVPEPAPLPEGVVLRSFRPGADDASWLAVNARAFATHPEQGRMTQADLDARMAEPWFDAESFLLAVRDDRLLGFCWLKVERAGASPDGGSAERVGEIYAVGVDPEAQGLRLGSALTRAGLRRLVAVGVTTAELYVEGDNTVALRTYSAAGFVRAGVDVQLGPVPS